jgi:hypothetical protein
LRGLSFEEKIVKGAFEEALDWKNQLAEDSPLL